MHLNTWSPVGGTVWGDCESLGCWALWEEVCIGGRLRNLWLHLTFSFFSASLMWMVTWSLSFLLAPAFPSHYGLPLSETIRPNKLYPLLLVLLFIIEKSSWYSLFQTWIYVFFVCNVLLCMWLHMRTKVHMWRPEDNSWELVLLFHYMGPRLNSGHQACSQPSYPLNHLQPRLFKLIIWDVYCNNWKLIDTGK